MKRKISPPASLNSFWSRGCQNTIAENNFHKTWKCFGLHQGKYLKNSIRIWMKKTVGGKTKWHISLLVPIQRNSTHSINNLKIWYLATKICKNVRLKFWIAWPFLVGEFFSRHFLEVLSSWLEQFYNCDNRSPNWENNHSQFLAILRFPLKWLHSDVQAYSIGIQTWSFKCW